MRQTLLVVILVIVLGSITYDHFTVQHVSAQVETPGRYQMVSGSFVIGSPNVINRPEPTVFKIDTATGKSWQYQAGVDAKGKAYSAWFPISD